MLYRVFACALILAACSSPDPVMSSGIVGTVETPAPSAPTADDMEARARAAGLNADQYPHLTYLDVPVVVPTLPDGWALMAFEAENEVYGDLRFPRYRLAYRHPSGTCFEIAGESEGIGDVFVEEPAHRRSVDVPRIARYGPILLGWDDGPRSALRSEWFGADGIAINLSSSEGEGCRPLDPGRAAALVADLRYLDPDDDVTAIGPMLWMDLSDPPIGEAGVGPTAEATAAQAFSMIPGEGRFLTLTETLRDPTAP